MFSIALICFRELLEVTLITGIIMASTQNIANRNFWVIGGIIAGVICSTYLAYSTSALISFSSSMNPDLINVVVLLTAVIMLNWTIISMKKHVTSFNTTIKNISHNLHNGNMPLYTIGTIIFFAVIREGIEIILFTYGIMKTSPNINYFDIISGLVIGGGGGIGVGMLLYYGIINIPKKYLFAITTALLVLLAASIAIQIPNHLPLNHWWPTLYETVWNSSKIIAENSLIGSVLHVTLGYVAQPSKLQLIIYITEIIAIGSILLLQKKKFRPIREV